MGVPVQWSTPSWFFQWVPRCQCLGVLSLWLLILSRGESPRPVWGWSQPPFGLYTPFLTPGLSVHITPASCPSSPGHKSWASTAEKWEKGFCLIIFPKLQIPPSYFPLFFLHQETELMTKVDFFLTFPCFTAPLFSTKRTGKHHPNLFELQKNRPQSRESRAVIV